MAKPTQGQGIAAVIRRFMVADQPAATIINMAQHIYDLEKCMDEVSRSLISRAADSIVPLPYVDGVELRAWSHRLRKSLP